MNRPIEFRGKRKDEPHKGEWVFGDLKQFPAEQMYISHGGVHAEIIPSTVGQFTGRCDKDGAMIFEGDKLSDKRNHGDFSDDIIEVIFADGMFCYKNYGILSPLNQLPQDEIEVIGNIHE